MNDDLGKLTVSVVVKTPEHARWEDEVYRAKTSTYASHVFEVYSVQCTEKDAGVIAIRFREANDNGTVFKIQWDGPREL